MTRRLLGSLAVAGLLVSRSAAAQPMIPAPAPFLPTLVPMPRSIEPTRGGLRVGPDARVEFSGYRDPRLPRAVERMRARLTLRSAGLSPGPAFPIRITAGGPESAGPAGSPDESYHLSVTSDSVRVDAPTPVGALRGIETFLQLVTREAGGLAVPAVEVDDRPRFPWRGLLLDVGRHFEPVDAIRRQLDGMAAAKLNVLHWHLSEDQGFPIESKRFPRLHQRGGARGYYTQRQVKEIVAYAADRGIRVVPEFDMPGHATSWFVGYPELASAAGPYRLETRFGVFRPAFDPTRESVYRFLDAFIGEMAALFPDPFWHIGGDEVDPRDWRASPRIKRFMAARAFSRPAQLQAYFNSRLAVILAKHHKRMIGWDEIMEGDLPPGTVVQSWRGPGVLAEAAVKGYPVILSYGLYLDHILPAEAHYGVDPIPAGYRGDPGLIWGGEACMWGEQISAPTVDSRIWPRLLGVGERLWSPATVGDIDDYYRRAEAVSRNLAEVGLGHEAHTVSMLARLAPAEARAPLERLLEIAVPVSFSERSRLQRPLTTTAHDRLVDVARPDAWRTRRTLIRLVARFLADTAGHLAGRDSLLAMVAGWREVAAQVAGLPRNSALVADAAPVATALGQMAEAAGAAIEAIAAGRTFDPSRSAAAKTLLGRVASPQGLLRLDVLPGIETLLTAAMTGRPTP